MKTKKIRKEKVRGGKKSISERDYVVKQGNTALQLYLWGVLLSSILNELFKDYLIYDRPVVFEVGIKPLCAF